MTTLSELLGEHTPQQTISADPWLARYGLSKNPFPPARTIIPQVLYDQRPALTQFANNVREMRGEIPQRRAIGVTGGTGGGKTHFLRHCQHLMRQYSQQTGQCFVVAEFVAGAGSVVELLRELLRKADEHCREYREVDFLTALIRVRGDASSNFDDVKLSELRSILNLLLRSSQQGFIPPDRDGRFNFETIRETTRKWMSGGALTQTEMRHLGVFSRLSTPSMATRVFTELMTLARDMNVVRGVVLCIDELETLFSSGIRLPKIQSFLQDLRYFFDESIKDLSGYSLLTLTASTQNGTINLRDYNYPLYQRLGFEGEGRIELEQIGGVEEAREFANVYIDYEFQSTRQERDEPAAQTPRQAYLLLSDGDIRSAYAAAAGSSSPLSQAVARVSQAQLLNALHQAVEKKRSASPS